MAVCAARLAARFAAVALFNCSTVKFDIRNYACNFNKPIECAHGIVTIFKVNRVFKNPDYPVRMPAADYRKLLTSRLSSIDKFAVCRDVLSLMDTLAVVAKPSLPWRHCGRLASTQVPLTTFLAFSVPFPGDFCCRLQIFVTVSNVCSHAPAAAAHFRKRYDAPQITDGEHSCKIFIAAATPPCCKCRPCK